ncbi:sigma-70 family RNA polymerase sigma factor [Macrococcus carouselicus]|uniref:Sigma-70 family RNA polymerase sigma factor n=1 Tax=Macrococcus carouselicus TaxID=69969 RepID=A0A9Q8CJI0_9STAP|nr:sigma-70 family RNA polymerase sigma factor [Macrococcus carouselicus]TDM04199.1 sigma-70 family RNA polymerase sigma factor [Macrococcus carouselicus]
MIGLFIMDVSGSTAYNNTEEISEKLQQLEHAIKEWTRPLNRSYVNFRMGDELFFVCDAPGSMLMLAYYIKLSWPLKSQTLKFGLTIGDSTLPDEDYEHWNNPIIKKARLALDSIKTNEQVDLCLDAPEASMINHVLFYYLTDILQQLTDIQREVLLNSLAFPVQRELAVHMDRSFSTVSTHLKKARSRQLALIEEELLHFSPETVNEEMRHHIRQTLQEVFQ